MDMDFVLIIFLKRRASDVTEYLGHCTMHARHPTGFTVSGPFHTLWMRTCLAAVTADLVDSVTLRLSVHCENV